MGLPYLVHLLFWNIACIQIPQMFGAFTFRFPDSRGGWIERYKPDQEGIMSFTTTGIFISVISLFLMSLVRKTQEERREDDFEIDVRSSFKRGTILGVCIFVFACLINMLFLYFVKEMKSRAEIGGLNGGLCYLVLVILAFSFEYWNTYAFLIGFGYFFEFWMCLHHKVFLWQFQSFGVVLITCYHFLMPQATQNFYRGLLGMR